MFVLPRPYLPSYFPACLPACVAALGLAALCLIAGPARAQYAYTDIDDPAASPPPFVGTQVTGISNDGRVIGTYYDAAHHQHAFSEVGGVYSAADHPDNALETDPNGVNTSGQVVGHYYDASGYSHDYFQSGGVFTSFDNPNGYANTTSLNGINDSGLIVGSYNAAGSGPYPVGHGFIYSSSGGFTAVDDPEATFGTSPKSINNSGRIVGQYSDDNGSYSFLDSGGVFTAVAVPGASSTAVVGINDAGQIAGSYLVTGSNNRHGFVQTGSSIVTLDEPKAAPDPYSVVSTFVTGINNSGQVVGYYTGSDGYFHGFVATPLPAPSHLSATAVAGGKVSLKWTAATGTVTRYDVYRGTASGAETLYKSAGTATTFVNATVTPATTYFYTIKAVSPAGTSLPSNEASATPTVSAVPGAPTNLTATASGGKVTLRWAAPSAGPVSSYSLYRGTASGAETFYKSTTSTTFVNGTVVIGTKYYYTVKAVNSAGTGAASNEASATP